MRNIIIVKTDKLKEKKQIEKILKKYGIISYEINKTKDFYKFEILSTQKRTGDITAELQNIGFGKSLENGVFVSLIVVNSFSKKIISFFLQNSLYLKTTSNFSSLFP